MTGCTHGYGSWRSFALWSGVAVAAEAVTLHLIDAGPLIRYQHYRPLAQVEPLIVLVLVGLISAVMAGLWRRRYLRSLAQGGPRWWLFRAPAAALLFVVSSAALSRDPGGYAAEVILATTLQTLNLGAVVLAVIALPDGAAAWVVRVSSLLDGPPRGGSPARALLPPGVLGGAIWVASLAALLAVLVYERMPHVPDEVVYLYQARTLASGALSTPAPAVPHAFTIYMMPTLAERWHSPFPPGWPAVLAVGLVFNVPWLVNPLLAGLNTILAYLIVRDLYGGRIASLVVLLLCVSPWHIFMAMSLMSHTLTMTLALASALGVLHARRSRSHRWVLFAGCSTGLLSLVRPPDGAAVAVGLGLVLLLIARRAGSSIVPVFAVGIVATGWLILPYNAQLTGNPFVMPLDAYYSTYYGPPANALGFGPGRGLGWELDAFPGHSPLEAALNALLNLFSVNVDLLGWGTGSLILVIVLLSSSGMTRTDYVLIAQVVIVVAVYSLYWYSGGPDFGARYWFLILLPLLVLSARGVEHLQARAREAGAVLPVGEGRVLAALGLLGALSILLYVPWRATDKYWGYLGMRPTIANLASERGFGRSLILVRGKEHPDYQAAWSNNPLDFDENVPIYARYLDDASVAQLRQAFPERPVWIVDGPSISQDTYRVREGPMVGNTPLPP